jgi:hypothetical protein
MNRRAFLFGLGATAAVATLPAKVLEDALDPDWENAIRLVLNQYINDFITFGQGTLLYNDVWPFVHNVDPATILAPNLGVGFDHLGRVIE